MKPSKAVLLGLLVVSFACGSSGEETARAPEPTPVSSVATGLAAFVDPFIGTGDAASPDPVGNGLTGGTFPGPSLPFGMVQLSPDTTRLDPPGYHHEDANITAFSFTHLNGAGCPAFRDLQILPFPARPDFEERHELPFSHANEKASPGFYEVKLASGIVVDLTATTRTGLARFVFPEGADAYVKLASNSLGDIATVNLDGFQAHIVGNDTITGSRDGSHFCASGSHYRIFYAIRFERPFDKFGTIDAGAATDDTRDVDGINKGTYVRFSTKSSRVVQMKVGLSYVSVEKAVANLDAENPGWDFDAVHRAAEDAWNARLAKVQVEGSDDAGRRQLYTALYHALLQPNVFSDVDGAFMGFDKQVHVDAARPRYANFSGWDVYRSWMSLVAVLAPKEASDIVRSLVGSGTECGALPRWSIANDDSGMMIGDPSPPTIASAWAFGARDFDMTAALALAVKNGTDPSAKCNTSFARPRLAEYLERGFCYGVGSELEGSVSITQEYALADYAVARMAQAANDEPRRAEFAKRAGAWRNVLDMTFAGGPRARPRERADVDGKPAFMPMESAQRAGFTEGNAEQYTFFVPHDPFGLIEALGGDAPFVARMDGLFAELNAGVSRPHFYMGNEPQFSTPWLYTFAGAPHRTQGVVRRILREVFADKPGGLPGNDDLGATSAWQAWAMLGIYPVTPGSGTLVLGTPWFPKTTITLGSGATLTLTTTNGGPDAPYTQSLRIGGQPSTRAFVTWDEIANGQTLDFDLGPTPNTQWGASKTDRPPAP